MPGGSKNPESSAESLTYGRSGVAGCVARRALERMFFSRGSGKYRDSANTSCFALIEGARMRASKTMQGLPTFSGGFSRSRRLADSQTRRLADSQTRRLADSQTRRLKSCAIRAAGKQAFSGLCVGSTAQVRNLAACGFGTRACKERASMGFFIVAPRRCCTQPRTLSFNPVFPLQKP